MNNIFLKVVAMIFAMSVTGCSNMTNWMGGNGGYPAQPQPNLEKQGVVGKSVDEVGRETNVNVTMSGGGEIGVRSMDSNDKSKMMHALDNSPGKSTQWTNGVSGVSYTVVPTRKVVIQNNPFCREYHITAAKGAYKREINGTACVTTDGVWHTV